MALKIKFDNTHNVIEPSLILMTRTGEKLGLVPATNVHLRVPFNSYSELSFDVCKADCTDKMWEDLQDFKLLWLREYNKIYEIYVELNEEDYIIKNIEAKSLGEAELSQLYLYEIYINTEEDFDAQYKGKEEKYDVTVLYDDEHPDLSLLNRLLDEKAPHYTINHVDDSVKSIQRSFTFDSTDIYSALMEVSEEYNVLIEYDCYIDLDTGEFKRHINVYDLEDRCLNCGERGNFADACTECGSSNILHGYGEDTTVFISTRNLADKITYTTDQGAVKTAFRVSGGDEDFTAAFRNINPNGGQYIYYFSPEIKDDMSVDLSNALDAFNETYNDYMNTHEYDLDPNDRPGVFSGYSALIDKYNEKFDGDNGWVVIDQVSTPVTGYGDLTRTYYDIVNFYYALNASMMPNILILMQTTAQEQANKLTVDSLSPIAVTNLSYASQATVNSTIEAMARTLVDVRFKVEIESGEYSESNHKWTGKIKVSNYSVEDDIATTSTLTLNVSDNYERYIKQKVNRSLKKDIGNEYIDIVELFDKSLPDFASELTNYSLQRLGIFRECCQGCMDVLVELDAGSPTSETGSKSITGGGLIYTLVSNPIAKFIKSYFFKQGDDYTYAGNTAFSGSKTYYTNNSIYNSFYLDYYKRLGLIDAEIKVREGEIRIIESFEEILENIRSEVRDRLDIHAFLADYAADPDNECELSPTMLYAEFCSFRREDSYTNENYISDGLSNAELIDRAEELYEVATKELIKSATLQHSISADVANLLVLEEFRPLWDMFEPGNWIRVSIDGDIHKLRLACFELDYDNIEEFSIEFTDVLRVADGMTDVESVLSQAQSMSTSYNAITRQAKSGKKAMTRLDDWVENGLSLATMNIVNDATNQNIEWGNHGMLAREYNEITGDYSDKQLKIINKGIYMTDDGWVSSKVGVGDFNFWNPETGEYQNAYGVIADTIVGNIILGEQVGIYNSENSIRLNNDGLSITTFRDNTDDSYQNVLSVNRKDEDGNITELLHFNDNGDLVVRGTFEIGDDGDTINDALERQSSELYNYQLKQEQYLKFDPNIGLMLRAQSSPFMTILSDDRLSFSYNNSTTAYMSGQQLYINNAVINDSMKVGDFYFMPGYDGSMAVIYGKGVNGE